VRKSQETNPSSHNIELDKKKLPSEKKGGGSENHLQEDPGVENNYNLQVLVS
jgi:hypothetical protein